MTTKQALSGILVLIVIVSAITSGLVSYAVLTANIPQKKTIGQISPFYWIVTMNNTTPYRAFNTSYRNVQGQLMYVQVYVQFYNPINQSVTVKAFVNQTAGNLNEYTTSSGVAESLKARAAANSAGNFTLGLHFYVPNFFYYSVNDTHTGSTVGPKVKLWLESIPPTGFGQIIEPILAEITKYVMAV